VTLTSGQRRQLDELADELARENPRLARALAGRWYVARRRRRATHESHRERRLRVLNWLAVVLTGAAAPLLILAVILAQPALLVLGSAALVNGPALSTVARLRSPPAA
jgi:hypothetical protein